MVAHRRSRVAGDGWPYLLVVGLAGVLVYRWFGWAWGIPFLLVEIALYLLFRDPWRDVPTVPLGALAPVDGTVIELGGSTDHPLPGQWAKVTIRSNHLGAYTVRAPIEGTIHDMPAGGPKGMWLRSEEQHDVVLTFPGASGALGPKAFPRYGERVGQGHRFAYLRLAPRAVLYLPAGSVLRVAAGDRVLAGETVLADLPG